MINESNNTLNFIKLFLYFSIAIFIARRKCSVMGYDIIHNQQVMVNCSYNR